MAVPEGHVDERGCVEESLSVSQAATDQKVLHIVRVPHDRSDVIRVAGARSVPFPILLPVGLEGSHACRPEVTSASLNHIRIAGPAPARSARRRTTGPTQVLFALRTSTDRIPDHSEDRSPVEVDTELTAVPIDDRTLFVGDGSPEDPPTWLPRQARVLCVA